MNIEPDIFDASTQPPPRQTSGEPAAPLTVDASPRPSVTVIIKLSSEDNRRRVVTITFLHGCSNEADQKFITYNLLDVPRPNERKTTGMCSRKLHLIVQGPPIKTLVHASYSLDIIKSYHAKNPGCKLLRSFFI